MAGEKKQKNTRVVTPRNKKRAWIESASKKVIPESTGARQDKLKGFAKAIQDGPLWNGGSAIQKAVPCTTSSLPNVT